MKKTLRKIIAACNSIINVAVVVFLVILFIIGCYVLWETTLIHTQANKASWSAYKPNSEDLMSFEELKSLNSDVIAWVTIYGTGIDYPVLYNEDPNFYTFRDPLKRNSLIGSVFLDSKCSPDFSNFKSILYGHHMEQHAMFGDIGNFLQEKYFNDRLYGNLYFNDQNHGLRIVGVISSGVSDTQLYSTNVHGFDNQFNHIKYIKENSKNWRDSDFDFEKNKLVLLSTCASSSNEDRTILVTYMGDETYENPFADEGIWPGVDDLQGWLGFPWTSWFAALILLILIIIYILWQIDKRKKKRTKNAQKIYGTYL